MREEYDFRKGVRGKYAKRYNEGTNVTGPNKQRALDRLRPYVERARAMRGWMFEDVRSVRVGSSTPWDYVARARELVIDAQFVLDMGTGGGERFAAICDGFAGQAIATEPWLGNLHVAVERLSAIGIPVVFASNVSLPFADGSFDLVLNRHEELIPSDVARVLAPGGTVLTQQIGPNHWQEIVEFFPRAAPEDDDFFQCYQDGFRRSGLTVTKAQVHDTQVAFESLGDFVYMLTAIPWTIPDFDVERDLDALLALEGALQRDEGIVLTESYFVIEARK